MLTLPLRFDTLGLRGWEKEPTPLKKKDEQFSLLYLPSDLLYIIFLKILFSVSPIEYKLNEHVSICSAYNSAGHILGPL